MPRAPAAWPRSKPSATPRPTTPATEALSGDVGLVADRDRGPGFLEENQCPQPRHDHVAIAPPSDLIRPREDPFHVRDDLTAVGKRDIVVDLGGVLAARCLVLERVADADDIFGPSQPVRRMLHAPRPRVRGQRLALAAAQPRAEEHAGVLGHELIEAEPRAPRDIVPPLGHRAHARPPAVMAAQRKDVAMSELSDDIREARHVAVDIVRRVDAERVAPITLADANRRARAVRRLPEHRVAGERAVQELARLVLREDVPVEVVRDVELADVEADLRV